MLAPPNTRAPSPLGWKDQVDLRGGLEESLTALHPPHRKGQREEEQWFPQVPFSPLILTRAPTWQGIDQ